MRVLLVQILTRMILGGILGFDVLALIVGLCLSRWQPYSVHSRYLGRHMFGCGKYPGEGGSSWYELRVGSALGLGQAGLSCSPLEGRISLM